MKNNELIEQGKEVAKRNLKYGGHGMKEKEVITSIEEVFSVPIGNRVSHTEKAKLGMTQMMNMLFSGGSHYDGYKVVTTKH